MKVTSIRVTVEHRVGLPNFSSVMMSVTEDVELEEGDKAIEVRDRIADRLRTFLTKKLKEEELSHAKAFKDSGVKK